MAIGRKGIFFTLMAILLLVFLIVGEHAITNSTTIHQADTSTARTRIMVLNTFMTTVDTHTTQNARVAGYIALQNLSKRIEQTGDFYNDINGTLFSCMTNPYMATACLNENQTINKSLQRLQDIALRNFSIDFTYFIESITITEETPLEVKLNVTLSYNITDANFASWVVKHKSIISKIQMNGIQDPLYSKGLHDGSLELSSKARQFNLTPFIRQNFNWSNFVLFYENKSYVINEGKAPSVLQRFAGEYDAKSGCCGIESVVHHNEVKITLLSDHKLDNTSYVDYYFFDRSNDIFPCNDQNKIREVDPPNPAIHLDTDHVFNLYNNSDVTVAVTNCIS